MFANRSAATSVLNLPSPSADRCKEGRKEGKKEGRKEGRKKTSPLFTKLCESGRESLGVMHVVEQERGRGRRKVKGEKWRVRKRDMTRVE